MPTSRLPDNPNLEQLKNHAKLLRRLVRAGFPEAAALVREFHPRLVAASPEQLAAFSLTDAQLVVARQYGFASWPKLRRYLDVITRYSRTPHQQPVGGSITAARDPAEEFLRLACLDYAGDDPARRDRARRLMADHPEVTTASIHTMAAAGEVAAATDLLARDPAQARQEGGPFQWEPLLYVAYSRLDSTRPENSTLGVARLLLEHGADPNAGYLWEGLPSPFTALAGAFGRGEGDPPPHQFRLELGRLLLEHGAEANDSQTLYNSGLDGDAADDYLVLLFEFGLGQGSGGAWHARLAPNHPTPAVQLQDELLKAASRGRRERVQLLLDHRVDVHGLGSGHPIFGGHSAYELATIRGHADVVRLLDRAGAAPATADPILDFLGACMRADGDTIDRLVAADPAIAGRAIAREPDLIVTAAGYDRPEAIRLMVGLGFDINTMRRDGARCSPLHEAAWNGNLALVELLLSLGADPTLEDCSYQSTALGWAAQNHQTEVVQFLERCS